jgi:hypothetical protein
MNIGNTVTFSYKGECSGMGSKTWGKTLSRPIFQRVVNLPLWGYFRGYGLDIRGVLQIKNSYSKIYIIGGLVDHNRLKDITF